MFQAKQGGAEIVIIKKPPTFMLYFWGCSFCSLLEFILFALSCIFLVIACVWLARYIVHRKQTNIDRKEDEIRT